MLDTSGFTTLRLEAEAGVALITIDVPGRAWNVLTPELRADLATAIDRIAASGEINGAIITSAREGAFLAGADLKDLVGAYERGITPAEGAALSRVFSADLRRLETCGKPFVAAVNGTALGAGLELALACHHRVLVDSPKTVVGLPEVTVGLLPGGGGTQRLPRLIGIEKSLALLTRGSRIKPAEALSLGIVHELAPAPALLAAARRWLQATPSAVAPWDTKGYSVPGGAGMQSAAVSGTFIAATALASKATQHNYPAPVAILSAVFEGTQLPIELGLRAESKYFGRLLAGPVARNLMRTMFVNRGRAEKLERRPAGPPPSRVQKLGVLGAGSMGAGIAHVSAAAGMDVVLLDSTSPLAERGKSRAEDLLHQVVERGQMRPEAAQEILARITPTTDFDTLAGCDLVIEAVFENRDVKRQVTQSTERVLADSAVLASNTSTLPITGLAAACRRPARFIGIHFFSPVEKMPLVEIIVGRRTSDATLARALDYVGQLRKVPIVVHDSRGFFTSRCFGTYSFEGQQLLAEGVEPALIENAGRMAGMPVGPLAVTDEVSLELQYHVIRQSRADLGETYEEPVAWPVIRHFVEDLKRPGRKGGAGFYDYPAGGKKRLWPGLRDEYPPRATLAADEVMKRLLYVQALEAAHCFEEGVVATAAEADLGSVLGWGFPAYTGGVLSFIDTMGVTDFVNECRHLAKRFGRRFKPSAALARRARSGEPFHPPTSTPGHDS